MPNATGQWYLSQSLDDGTVCMGTLSLQQEGAKISGKVEWDDNPDGSRVNQPHGSIVGVMIETIVSFSVIYPGNLVSHYAADFSVADVANTHGIFVNNTGESGSWSAGKAKRP